MKKPKLNLKKLSEKAEPLSNGSEQREACLLCGLFRNVESSFVRPSIPEEYTRKALFLGDGNEGGRVGRLLRRLSKKARYKEQDVALYPIVRCHAENSKAPTMQQIRCCRPFVLQVIRKLRPKVVLALGASAMRSLRNIGESNVTKNRGKQFDIPGL